MNKPGKQMRRSDSCASGFSLIETVIAIAVVAVTFIGIIGLLGLGVANDQTSTEQTVATNIATSIIADLRSTPNYASNSTRYNLPLPASVGSLATVTPTVLYFDNAQNAVASTAGPAYKASIFLTQIVSVGPTPQQVTDSLRVLISWPAQAGTASVGNVDIITQFRIN